MGADGTREDDEPARPGARQVPVNFSGNRIVIRLMNSVWRVVAILLSLSITGLAAAGSPGAPASKAVEREHARRTVADMLVIRTAIDAYAADHYGTLPGTTDIGVLAALLEPEYAAKIPHTDAWGNAFGVMINPDAKMYRIVAAGADRRFEVAGWEDTEPTSDYARDLVLFNGEFVGTWETKE